MDRAVFVTPPYLKPAQSNENTVSVSTSFEKLGAKQMLSPSNSFWGGAERSLLKGRPSIQPVRLNSKRPGNASKALLFSVQMEDSLGPSLCLLKVNI